MRVVRIVLQEIRADGILRVHTVVIGTCLLVFAVLLVGCMSLRPPSNTADLCKIFAEKRFWYRSALKAERERGIPVAVMMAIIKRESSYIHNARPPRSRILFVIPWKRPSTAYGYSQALNETWSDYKERTGKRNASRTNFRDAIDFVGWYLAGAMRETGLSAWDAKNLYLTYYAGVTGYRSGQWRNYPGLEQKADQVHAVAATYAAQLQSCTKGPARNYN